MSVRRQQRKSAGGVKEFWIVDIKFKCADGHIERVRKVPPRQTRVAAKKLEREILDELQAGTYGKVKAVVPTLAQFTPEFLAKYAASHNKPSEQATKKRILEGHLVPALGLLPLDAIGPKDVDAYTASKRGKLGPKTINNHLMVLGRLLRVAVDWGVLQSAPRFKSLKAPEPEFDFLDFEETHRLIAACHDNELRRQVIFMVNTGLRMGEVRALRWENVDLVKGQMVVRFGDWKGIDGTPKGGRKRVIPLNAVVLDALREHRHLRGKWIFCRKDGSKFGEHPFAKLLATACRRAGLRQISWHVLRHTFASHLVMRGVPLRAVQELMGHATIEMTIRYAHLSPDACKEAVDSLLQGQPGGNFEIHGKKGEQKQSS